MHRSIHFLGCILPILPLGICATALAAEDPPHKHYAVSHLPADPGLQTARPIGRYRGFLRQSVDLSRLMPPVGDQGDLGSGIAWAVAYAARSYYAGRNEGRNIDSPDNEASPSYVFDLARRGDCSNGATITETVDVLRRGALSLAAYPYKSSCESPPDATSVAAARDFRVKGYRVLDTRQIDDVKGQLERGNPVIALFRVSPAFEDFRGAGTFQEEDFAAPQGEDNWQPLTIIGYDDSLQAVRVMNSWGGGWGDKGRAWVSYAALTHRTKGAVVLDVAAPASLPPVEKPPAPTEPPVQPPEPPKVAKQPEPPKPAQGQKSAEDQKPAEQQKTAEVPPQRIEPPKPRVKPTLAEARTLACSKITETPVNGTTRLDGYVASDDDYAKVREVATTTPGYALGKVTVAPWPLCEALGTLEKPLKAADMRPVLHTSPAEVAKAGDTLRVALDAPATPSYVYLSYFTADEKVITLAQPQGAVLPQTPPKYRQVFGNAVQAQFGREMVVAIASASPLFDDPLPQVQSEREFLSTLRKALVYRPVANLPERRVGAAIEILTTRPD